MEGPRSARGRRPDLAVAPSPAERLPETWHLEHSQEVGISPPFGQSYASGGPLSPASPSLCRPDHNLSEALGELVQCVEVIGEEHLRLLHVCRGTPSLSRFCPRIAPV